MPFLSGIIVDANGRARHTRPGWHGGFVEVSGAGPGLMRGLLGAAAKHGFAIHSDTEVLELEPAEGNGSVKIHARNGDGERKLYEADAVVLAAGGFQADSEWRTRCLGPGWDLARVRVPFNTGAGIKMAMALGAAPYGNWSGAHAVAWSVGSGEAGNPNTNHIFERESYPFGITINTAGRRFIDEGSDFGAYTYARYGREILRQEEQRAWQLFDARTAEHLMDEYKQRNPYAAREREDSVEALAKRLTDRGADGDQMLRTIAEFNDAVDESLEFNPYIKDGRGLGAGHREDQLGAGAARAALRGLRGHVRDHVHVRRRAHHRRRIRARRRQASAPRHLRRGRDGRRALLLQLRQRHGPHLRRGDGASRRPGGGDGGLTAIAVMESQTLLDRAGQVPSGPVCCGEDRPAPLALAAGRLAQAAGALAAGPAIRPVLGQIAAHARPRWPRIAARSTCAIPRARTSSARPSTTRAVAGPAPSGSSARGSRHAP